MSLCLDLAFVCMKKKKKSWKVVFLLFDGAYMSKTLVLVWYATKVYTWYDMNVAWRTNLFQRHHIPSFGDLSTLNQFFLCFKPEIVGSRTISPESSRTFSCSLTISSEEIIMWLDHIFILVLSLVCFFLLYRLKLTLIFFFSIICLFCIFLLIMGLLSLNYNY